MKKNHFLLSGLLFLGAAVGITSYAVKQNAPQFAAAADSGLKIEGTIPAQDAKVPTTEPVTTIIFQTDDNTDMGININRAGGDIIVKKDGVQIQVISCSEVSAVKQQPSWPGNLQVTLSTPLSEPGLYTVELPASVLSSEGFGSEGSTSGTAGAYTLNFEIVPAINYQILPAPGKVGVGELNTITLTYPEGAVVSAGTATTKVQLFNYNPAGLEAVEEGQTSEKYALLSDYTLSVSGNVATLTANNPDAIVIGPAKNCQYVLRLPQDLLKVNYEGKEYVSTAKEYSNYSVSDITLSMFKFKPELNSATAISAEQLKTIKVSCTAPIKKGSAATAAYLYTDGITYSMGPITYMVSGSTGSVLTLEANTKSSGNAHQDPTKLVSGKYILQIPRNGINVNGKNITGALDFKYFNVAGLENLPIKELSAPTLQTLNGTTGSKAITIKFYQAVTVANPDAEIVYKKDGVQIGSAKAGETTTASAKTTGAVTVGYNMCAANVKGYGVYTVEIPAGTFKATVNAEAVNEAMTLTINNSAPVAFENPGSWYQDPNNSINVLDQIEFIYPEGYTVEIPAGKETGNCNYYFGQNLTNVKNAAEAGVARPTFSSTYTQSYTLKADGNKLTVSFNPAFAITTVAGKLVGFNFADGTWNLVKDGVSSPATGLVTYYQFTKYTPGVFSAADGDLKEVYTSAEEFPDFIYYTLNQKMNSSTKPVLTMTKPDGKTVVVTATYKEGTTPANTVAVFDTKNFKSAMTLGGTYTFEIAKGKLKVVTTYVTTEAQKAPFSVDIPYPVSQVFTLGTPAAYDVNNTNCYGAAQGHPMGMGCIELNTLEGINIVEDSEAKAELWYEGKFVANALGASFTGIMGAADPIETVFSNKVAIFFLNTNDEVTSAYTRTGEYTVKIPAGLFTYNNKPVAAGEFKFNYSTVEVKWEATISPESDSEVEDKLEGISIEFEGASSIDYDYGCCKLYGPDNNQITFYPSTAAYIGTRGLKWTFGDPKAKPIEWVDGTYTVKFPAKSVYVNLQQGMVSEGNWPAEDLSITYVVKSRNTAVSIVGIEAADAYTVYTLDGKAVLVNGSADQLIELEAGFYIINGKKALVRK